MLSSSTSSRDIWVLTRSRPRQNEHLEHPLSVLHVADVTNIKYTYMCVRLQVDIYMRYH